MSENRLNYTFPSSLDSAKQAEDAALEFAASAGFQSDELLEIAIAVREAVTNAVLHGNAFHPDKIVQVTLERNPGTLKIIVSDQGSGFDPEPAPDPWAPENLSKEDHRGIPLMRATMDEIHCRRTNPGTEMTLIKHLRKRPLDTCEKKIS